MREHGGDTPTAHARPGLTRLNRCRLDRLTTGPSDRRHRAGSEKHGRDGLRTLFVCQSPLPPCSSPSTTPRKRSVSTATPSGSRSATTSSPASSAGSPSALPGQDLDIVLSQPHGGRSQAEGDALLALVTQGSLQAAHLPHGRPRHHLREGARLGRRGAAGAHHAALGRDRLRRSATPRATSSAFSRRRRRARAPMKTMTCKQLGGPCDLEHPWAVGRRGHQGPGPPPEGRGGRRRYGARACPEGHEGRAGSTPSPAWGGTSRPSAISPRWPRTEGRPSSAPGVQMGGAGGTVLIICSAG